MLIGLWRTGSKLAAKIFFISHQLAIENKRSLPTLQGNEIEVEMLCSSCINAPKRHIRWAFWSNLGYFPRYTTLLLNNDGLLWCTCWKCSWHHPWHDRTTRQSKGSHRYSKMSNPTTNRFDLIKRHEYSFPRSVWHHNWVPGPGRVFGKCSGFSVPVRWWCRKRADPRGGCYSQSRCDEQAAAWGSSTYSDKVGPTWGQYSHS